MDASSMDATPRDASPRDASPIDAAWIVRSFPYQPRSAQRLLRSWRREERRQGSEVLQWVRRTGLIALLVVLPLLALRLQRRAVGLEKERQQSRDDTIALMEADLAVTNRIARDWGHWDDAYRFMRGLNPGYPSNNLANAALFDDGAVMVLLDPQGLERLSFSRPDQERARHPALVRCLRDNLGRLPQVRSTLRIACRDNDGLLYLGTATSVSNNDATAPRAGTIALFDPLLKHDYSARIQKRLHALERELVLAPPGDRSTTALVPAIHGGGNRMLALRRPNLLPSLVGSLLEELPLLLGLGALATGLRALQMLERRSQHLRKRLMERSANHRIRRLCHSLDQLVSDLDRSHRLADPPPPTLPDLAHHRSDAPAPAAERRLNQVTHRFHQVLSQTRSLALQDPLTGLPNRRCFLEELETRARQARVQQRHLAILFVDIDRFKAINDAYGHAVGDGVLVGMAQRLCKVLAPGDCLARYGGDELALILHLADGEPPSPAQVAQHAQEVALRLAETVREPMRVGDHTLAVTLSIGTSLLDPQEEEIQGVLRRSDQAMYAMKRAQRQAG